MFVSGGNEVVMWLPERAVNEEEEDDDMDISGA
jgi:hypothetical protein